MNLEPDTLDNDLLHIEEVYKGPSFFKLLLDKSETDIVSLLTSISIAKGSTL